MQRKDKYAEAKKIFFDFCGNTFFMYNDGMYESYQAYKVLRRIEKAWREELIQDLTEKLYATDERELEQKLTLLGSLMDVGTNFRHIYGLICTELDRETDTFYRIRLCEDLKRMMGRSHDRKLIREIGQTLSLEKAKLLHDPITISDTFKTADYLAGYDFSDESIMSRIQEIECD